MDICQKLYSNTTPESYFSYQNYLNSTFDDNARHYLLRLLDKADMIHGFFSFFKKSQIKNTINSVALNLNTARNSLYNYYLEKDLGEKPIDKLNYNALRQAHNGAYQLILMFHAE